VNKGADGQKETLLLHLQSSFAAVEQMIKVPLGTALIASVILLINARMKHRRLCVFMAVCKSKSIVDANTTILIFTLLYLEVTIVAIQNEDSGCFWQNS
jgi:hypothetical protein